MLTIVSDTHGTSGHRLEGRTLEAVRSAEYVLHAGDFTTEAVYEAFEREATDLVAVAGNSDTSTLAARLPRWATLEWEGFRFLVVHGHEHAGTSLSVLARQENADVVVVGHSHRPHLGEVAGRLLLNPGSHADPRRFHPAHIEVNSGADGVRVTLSRPDGKVISEVSRTNSARG